MFSNLFKRKGKQDWRPSKVDIEGTYNNIKVTLNDFPILENHHNKLERKSCYSDFNYEFIRNLQKKIGDYSQFEESSSQNSPVFTIKLSKASVFTIQIDLLAPYKKRLLKMDREEKFFSDISDALINAFKDNNINR